MKKAVHLIAAVVFAAAALCSCKVEKQEIPADPVIVPDEISAKGISVPSEGGVFTIGYTIENPVEGVELYASSEQSWIGSFVYENGKVSFPVEENELQESRNGSVRLFYEGAKVIEIVVLQQPSSGPVFEFLLKDMTSTGVTVDVQPSDKMIYYTWNIVEKKDVTDDKYGNDDILTAYAMEIVESDLEYYINYVDSNGKITDVLQMADDLLRVNVLDPATEYQIFAFGIDPENRVRSTEISRMDFSTNEFKVQSDCKFNIAFEDLKQTEMTFRITPDDAQVRYYVGLCPTMLFESSTPEDISLEYIRRADAAGVDWEAREALHTGELLVNTFEDMGLSDLKPGESYTIVVFGVSGLGERTTEVSYSSVVLPEVVSSDMTFEITLEKQTESGAVLKIVPSSKDETYIAGCIQYVQYEQYIGKDEEFMEYVVTSGGMGVYEGDQVLDKSTALISDTKYVCFAFGYSGGVTTPLTVFEFMTGKPDTGGSAEVEVTEVVVKDGAEVGYDGMAAVYAYLKPNSSAAHWYAQAFTSENGECTGNFGITFTDTEVINLLLNPSNSNRYEDSEYVAVPIDWDTEITFCIIAVDEEGNAGPLVKKTVIPKKSDL